MSGVELGLAIVAAIDLCLKQGKQLIGTCTCFRDAETHFAERVLCIESQWKRTALQLEFLRRIWNYLDEEHQVIQQRLLHVLIGKLESAVSKLNGILFGKRSRLYSVQDAPTSISKLGRWKYAFFKESIDETIEDLRRWQNMFDPSWFLIFMAASPNIDAELAGQNDASPSQLLTTSQHLRNNIRRGIAHKTSVFLPEDGLRGAAVYDIPFSSAKVAIRSGSSKILVLDSISRSIDDSIQQLTKDIRDLAQKCVHVDPVQFGLFQCHGVIRSMGVEQISFTFVFRTPEGYSTPQSLRAHLIDQRTHSLSDRLNLAKSMARSISFVHTLGFVHKDLCPENILIATDDCSSLGQVFLVGFEGFRAAEGRTLRIGDAAWNKNIYRHPCRQGKRPEYDYIMQHDIYSLGVCLLELGLWSSFVLYDDRGHCVPCSDLGELLGGTISKEVLVSLAERELPQRVGTKYAEIVETCLTCLDKDNVDFGDRQEFEDADGVLVGVRYIEKVLVQLDQLVI